MIVKKLAAFIIILLLICGGALWFLANGSLNDFIKTQIEVEGSKVTSQQVNVTSVEMKLMEGAGIINGFSLTNPSKYKYKHAFSFEEAKTVFFDPYARLIEDPEHSELEDRYILLGFEREDPSVDRLSLLS